MSTMIFKYPLTLDISGYFHVNLFGYAAKPISVGLDPMGIPCLWATAPTSEPLAQHRFYAVWTGQEMPLDVEQGTYVGQIQTGALVWHIFHVGPVALVEVG